MEESGFYKNDNGDLLFAPNYVINQNYELYRGQKDKHEYPVDGWHWFDTRQEALDFFDLTEKESKQSFQSSIAEYLKNNLDGRQ